MISLILVSLDDKAAMICGLIQSNSFFSVSITKAKKAHFAETYTLFREYFKQLTLPTLFVAILCSVKYVSASTMSLQALKKNYECIRLVHIC